MCIIREWLNSYLPMIVKVVGIYAIIWWSIENLKSAFEYLYSSIIDHIKFQGKRSLREEYGLWAVVTGSTDGIGKYYAIELAKREMNVCLISRSESKLTEVASEIQQNYKVMTKIVVADFSHGKIIYDDIRSQLRELDVGILINNVGAHPEFPDNHENILDEDLWSIININTGAITIMSKIVIPSMKLKRRGLILNVSSASQFMPLPLAAIYGASKSFTRSLSIALQHELTDFNIKVHLLIPMYVKTNITQNLELPDIKDLFFPHSKTFVESAMKTLGKCSQTAGYLFHSFQFTILSMIPEFIRINLAHISYKNFRQQFLRKRNHQIG